MTRQRNARQQLTAAGGAFEEEMEGLKRLTIEGLRARWLKHFNSDPARVRSSDVLMRIFAWKLQEEHFGGLDGKTERRLAEIARALERDESYRPTVSPSLSAGVVLTREWKGTTHRVTTLTRGFEYAGKHYRSLSDVARSITGTRWSGPRFFGLEQRSGRKRNGTASRGEFQ